MRKPKKLVNLTLTVAASLTLLTGCGAPNMCDTNHSFQETRIEVRNYQVEKSNIMRLCFTQHIETNQEHSTSIFMKRMVMSLEH